MIVGCHWPVLKGKENIRRFCSEPREFVFRTEELVLKYLRQHTAGVTWREMCGSLGPQLRGWPASVNLDLAFALPSHLHRGIELGYFAATTSNRPILYHVTSAEVHFPPNLSTSVVRRN